MMCSWKGEKFYFPYIDSSTENLPSCVMLLCFHSSVKMLELYFVMFLKDLVPFCFHVNNVIFAIFYESEK